MILNMDCLTGMATLPDATFDAIVCDPPYELGFMGRSWDSTGIAYRVDLWREALRVLKPGGHLLAFSGSRTYHRMAVAIEDAGFEIRDQIMWVYGSGFPKSLDVSKAIDKRGGHPTLTVEVAAALKQARESRGMTKTQADSVFCGGSTLYSWYEGRPAGIQLPTSSYMRIIADAWPELEKYVGLTMEAEREVVGTGDKPRPTFHTADIGGEAQANEYDITAPATDAARQWAGWGTALKPAHEPIVVARKSLIGTVAANVLAHGTGAINIDACRAGDRWPANLAHDGSPEVVTLFPDSNGSGGSLPNVKITGYGDGVVGTGRSEYTPGERTPHNAGSGSAARFFYCAKASKRDRDAGNIHPTVKPTALMRYLVRLVTPPGGTVLDPFAGSGSTGKAAILEGFAFIGFEREAEYAAIAQARIDAAVNMSHTAPPTVSDAP